MKPLELTLISGEPAKTLSVQAARKPADLSQELDRLVKALDAQHVSALLKRAYGQPSFALDAFRPARAWVLKDNASGEIVYIECWEQTEQGVYIFSNKACGLVVKFLQWLERSQKRQHLTLLN